MGMFVLSDWTVIKKEQGSLVGSYTVIVERHQGNEQEVDKRGRKIVFGMLLQMCSILNVKQAS